MAELRTPSLQKGELLEACSMLPLKHLPGLTLRRKLILEEGDLPCKTFGDLAFFASALDTRSSAFLFARAARSSASLTRRVALCRTIAASRAGTSAVSTATAQAPSASAMASRAWVTSTYNAGTSALLWDRRCGCKTQTNTSNHRGSRQNKSSEASSSGLTQGMMTPSLRGIGLGLEFRWAPSARNLQIPMLIFTLSSSAEKEQLGQLGSRIIHIVTSCYRWG
jgi:hypothetical protein